MNTQEAFDIVWDWFVVKKNKQSYSKRYMSCMYRGPYKRKCAVGCLIPDELYQKEFEGRSTGLLLRDYVRINDYLKTVAPTLLVTLQRVHDSWSSRCSVCFLSYMESKLRNIADTYQLTVQSQ